MKGAGNIEGDVRGLFDEQTRVGPIPLTVKRSRVNTPVEFDFPVVASVDVDLGTPAPLPFPITITAPNKSSGKSSGLPAPTSASSPSWGALTMQPRPPSPSRPYIQPTPTFSFTDPPESGPMWTHTQTQRRASSGPGLFAIGVLMALAGVGGYLTVKYHAWQEVAPLVERAKELGRSLRTLAPSASPESPVPASSAPPSTPAATAPAPQALHPTVVPIEPTAPPVAAPAARVADRTKRRSPERRSRRRLQPLSDEAAAEEALLAAPARGR